MSGVIHWGQCREEFHWRYSVGEKSGRLIFLGEFHGRQLSGGQLPRGELFRSDCLGGKSLASNCPVGDFMGAIVRGKFSRVELPLNLRKAYIIHTINLFGKAYTT